MPMAQFDHYRDPCQGQTKIEVAARLWAPDTGCSSRCSCMKGKARLRSSRYRGGRIPARTPSTPTRGDDHSLRKELSNRVWGADAVLIGHGWGGRLHGGRGMRQVSGGGGYPRRAARRPHPVLLSDYEQLTRASRHLPDAQAQHGHLVPVCQQARAPRPPIGTAFMPTSIWRRTGLKYPQRD